MSQRETPDIDQLLNSYIDGELTEREQTEVQRLISHDEQVARRLRRLQKTQMLVGSLPRAEAPAQILNNVKASMQREKVIDEPVWSAERFQERAGVRHLMARKVFAAAAMIGLVAIFGGVIYTIVAPDTDHRPDIPTLAFNGRLELKTDALKAVNTFIKEAIEDNRLSDSVSLKTRGSSRVYSVTCGREDLNLLLADLADISDKCVSNRLVVETKALGEQVFDDISVASVTEIVKNLTTIPKPEIASIEPNEKPTVKLLKQKQVRLTIVVENTD